jgi:hypothetical protein
MVSEFCRVRVAPLLPPRQTENLRRYLLQLLKAKQSPPCAGRWTDWPAVCVAAGIDEPSEDLAQQISPIFDALRRHLHAAPHRAEAPRAERARRVQSAGKELDISTWRKKPGPKARPTVEFPAALFEEWDEPESFAAALNLHMGRHGDTTRHLRRAMAEGGHSIDLRALSAWRKGAKAPREVSSLLALGWIERRYRLPEGYFKERLPHPVRAAKGHRLHEVAPSERRRLAWHLPDDFDQRPLGEREQILEWIRSVILSGSTEYRRYQAAAMKHRYALRFRIAAGGLISAADEELERNDSRDPELALSDGRVPAALDHEMAELVHFKTATLTPVGFQRNGNWSEATALQKLEHLGLMFGALAASPSGPVRGFGVSVDHLCFAMLVFPAVWDWYVQWRERRRGFYTMWEVDMLRVAMSLTRRETGWLRQSPHLISRLQPINGLLTAADIAEATKDWPAACDRFHAYANRRVKEVQRVARVHRDPFEAILPILQADSPVAEYRRIADEILRRMPDKKRYPLSAAEAVRAYLMLRLGLHLGVRQKNLRQLLICPRGRDPLPERKLEDLGRGEMRWNDRAAGWEVLIPAAAFKNSHSSFFGSKPFRLTLPNLGELYPAIGAYLDGHRQRLLRDAPDPGTLFVKTVKRTSSDAAFDQNTFYEAWRLAIQRYGIFNPYTGRGVIDGLLPHGPHSVRDVLATHILKQTGSFEQASYAIQDTPEMVAKHYGRFLPQDKSALAAKILNKVWEAA